MGTLTKQLSTYYSAEEIDNIGCLPRKKSMPTEDRMLWLSTIFWIHQHLKYGEGYPLRFGQMVLNDWSLKEDGIITEKQDLSIYYGSNDVHVMSEIVGIIADIEKDEKNV